jgi:integrase
MPDWLQPLQPSHRPPGRTPAPVGDGPISFERAVERFAEGYVSSKTGRIFSLTSRQNIRDNLLGTPLTSFRRERGIEAVAAWNGDLAAEYLQWLQVDLRRDSATIKKVRGQLRSFGAYCDEHFGTEHAAGGALTTLRVSPATDYERRRVRALTQREAGILIKAALTGRDRLMVAMLLYTGMRPSELLALDEQHIRLDRTPPVVEIRGTVHDPDATKARAGFRDVPLTVGQSIVPGLLRAHLIDLDRPVGEGRLFLSLRRDHSGRAQPLTLEGLKSMLAKLGAATGIKCNAYRLRHTFCSWCADAGMQMLHLQQLLGHASSDMVASYYGGKTSESVLQAAARVRF